MQLFIGIMSGTSLDGVDVALVRFDNDTCHLENMHFAPYPAALKFELLALHSPSANELEATVLMGNRLAEVYADAVNNLLISAHKTANDINAIGCHGQTIRHRPELGFTLQIGNAASLAELTNITVVSDFRSRDIAAGGQGAPLVPAFHKAVFASKQANRALVNIGGIANITYLPSNGEVLGFDSGPGNMLLDAWVKQHLGKDYDANGAWAATGEVIEPLLSSMLADPYFSLPPPKSTGRDLFNDTWLAQKLSDTHYRPQDVARTLVALTAHSIHDALTQSCGQVDEVYLCGGGAHNTLLKNSLQTLLGETKVFLTDDLGVGVDWVEAAAFAWLAKQTLENKPSNLPAVTGARGLRVLGAIYPK